MRDITSAVPDLDFLWRETTGVPEVCVAVLDGGVDLEHPCLASASLECVEAFPTGACHKRPRVSHGTHVTSIILGRSLEPPAESFRGIAPGCRGLLIPLFQETEEGRLQPCSQADLAAAISLAVEKGASVINLSAGELSPPAACDETLRRAVEEAARKAVIVAAAGNDSCDCVHIPATLPEVLAVGAASRDGRPLPTSNWGGAYRRNGLLAPGEAIQGATVGGGFQPGGGTSVAAAVASGIAALLCSLQWKRQGRIDPGAVRAALLDHAGRCQAEDAERCLTGLLDIRRAYSGLFKANGESAMTSDESKTCLDAPSGPTPKSPGATEPGLVTSHCSCGSSSSSSSKECSCGSSPREAPDLVFAIGTLGIDFGSEARKISMMQTLNASGGSGGSGDNGLLNYLQQHPYVASSMIWTLNIDSTPLYAVLPYGPFAAEAYVRLREFLADQEAEDARVAIGGVSGGKARLASGQEIPVLIPDLRAMFNWTSSALLEATTPPADQALRDRMRNFMDRIYYELRNPGIRPEERALNFAATNLVQVQQVYRSALQENLELDRIEVERSPLGSPGADNWDVKMTFFDPAQRLERARKVYRFTVNVSDVVPFLPGAVRSWSVY